MNAARNLLSIIRNEDEGQQYLSTLQKLPILFWLDIQLRRRTLYKENESFLEIFVCFILPLCLLILQKRTLSFVYKVILCAFFMKLTFPFLQNIQQKKSMFRVNDLPSLIQEQKLYIRTYVFGEICFLSISLCISTIQLIADKLSGPRRRLLVLGMLFSGNYIVKFVCPSIPKLGEYKLFCLCSQHLVLILFSTELFKFDVFLITMLMLTLTHMLARDLTFYIYVISALFLMQHYDIRDLIFRLKSQLLTLKLKSVIRERIMYPLFSYTLISIIAIMYELHQANDKEASTYFILHKIAIILCSTLFGTACYIIFVMYIFLIVIYLVAWFLHGNCESISESNVLGPVFILAFIAIHTFKVGYVYHGSAMCCGLLLTLPTVLEEIHKQSEPVLLSLGTSVGSHLLQNCKPLSVYMALISLPIVVVYYLLKFELSEQLGIVWTIILMSYILSVSITAFGSVLLYALLAFDTYRTEPLENLDDIMYWIRAVGGSAELGIGILNIFYFGWYITANQWSWMCFFFLVLNILKTYFSVTKRWEEFQKRRLAVKRLAFLQNATNEQLLQNNDVCAICLRPMRSAKITPCHHLFHEPCLKRWSYVKETCPLCNEIINVDWLFQRIVSGIIHERGNIQ